MRSSNGPHPREAALLELATAQHDVVAHHQLIELGFGAAAITYRLKSGRLHQLYEGVYAVGRPGVTTYGRWKAATLACGHAAALSHRDGAALWRLLRSSSALIDVTAPGRSRNRRPGLRVHRPRRLDPGDVTVVDNIPVTTVERTIIDLAPSLSLEWLTRAWDNGIRQELLDLDKMFDLRARSRGRRGLKKIDYLLAQQRVLPERSRSELERDGHRLFAEATDVPTPCANVWIPNAALEADLVWSAERAVVELDHEEWHAKTRMQRERDNHRDFRLQLARYRVLRVSDFRLRTDPQGVLDDVRKMLATRERRAA